MTEDLPTMSEHQQTVNAVKANITSLLHQVHNELERLKPSRAMSLVITKLDEARLWLGEIK